jgi:DNA-binding response OmpR family regulator
MPKRILVVDNELHSRNIVAYFLREENYEVVEADDGPSALELLEEQSFDLLICDIVMPRLSAFGLIDQMKSRSLSAAIILITGYPQFIAPKWIGDVPYFTKPFNMYDLLHKIRNLLGN